MRYKVGDKVRVRQWDDMAKEFYVNDGGNIFVDGYYFVNKMKQFCGKVYKVCRTNLYGENSYLLNSEDEIIDWLFTEGMLEDVNSLSYTPDSPTLKTENVTLTFKNLTPKNKEYITTTKKEDKEMKQKTQRERLEEQLDTYQRDSEVKAIDIIVPEKIVKVTMNDCLGTALITKCHKDDTFSLEKAIIVAYVKYSSGNLTSKGIEYETERFSHFKDNMKKLKKAMKVYEIQQKLKALDEEEERIRANKKRKKIAQKKRRAERLAEEKLKETKEAAKIYAEELKSVLAGYDIPVETTDKIVKDMNTIV